MVFRLSLPAQLFDHGVDLVLGHVAALDAHGLGVFGLAEQQVAQSDEVFGAGRVQDDTAVDAASHIERDAVRDVRLDKARDDVGGRALRGHDKVDAGRARKLRDAADGEFHFFANVHHEVGKLVDDDDDVGQLIAQIVLGRLLPCLFGGLRGSLPRLHFGVVLPDVARAHFREHLQAALHLGNAPAERASCFFGLRDNGYVKVRDAVVRREFHALRIDHDEAHFGGRGAHEDGHDHGVDGHGFARAGGAADKQVRHLCQVGHDAVALDVFADGDLQRAGTGVFDDVAKQHGLARAVRHLYAHVVRTGNRREDAHARRGQRQRDVVFKSGDAADAHAGGQIDLEQRDRWAGNPADYLRHDVEVFERFLQACTCVLQLGIGGQVFFGVG